MVCPARGLNIGQMPNLTLPQQCAFDYPVLYMDLPDGIYGHLKWKVKEFYVFYCFGYIGFGNLNLNTFSQVNTYNDVNDKHNATSLTRLIQ